MYTKYTVKIIFSNNEIVDLILDSTPLASVYQDIYKHLRNVPVPFRDWDNPFYRSKLTQWELVEKLIIYANKVGVQINQESCLARDQNYFNYLHTIYEKNYNGNPDWLDFHEHIHLCERTYPRTVNTLQISYREKSGMLEKPINPIWIKNSTTNIKTGDVYVSWAELGKTPYNYWYDKEPDNIDRMCELIKPWQKLRPIIFVALEDICTLQNINVTEFAPWWEQYSQPLCQYWNIPS